MLDIKTAKTHEIEIPINRSTTGPEIWGDCPFCGKTGKLYKSGGTKYFGFRCPNDSTHDIFPGVITRVRKTKNEIFTIR